MTDDTAQDLRDAASTAHRRGDTASAVALYEKILDLFPDSPEAIDAMFYLSSIGRGRRRPAKRAAEKLDAPASKSAKGREA